jgi:two-component system sensor histidine kinase DctS
MDLCMPRSGPAGPEYLVATFVLARLLEQALPARAVRDYEFSFVEADGTRLAHAGARRGSGSYVGERAVDLAGLALQLRVSAVAGAPSLIPNLAVALVLGLSFALFALVIALARDVRRRALAESALAEALAERRAMEDSLVTGLRVRDLDGRITYVNPAFCKMVGYSADALHTRTPPPYWPPELVDEYTQRQSLRHEPGAAARAEAREGFESVFLRASGERFPVMIYEAPLIDASGRHSGWMGAVVDLTAQRRIEELSRQQQERLQASARLATVGEMASLMSHELNQPLAAIASYASGSLNLLDAPEGESAGTAELLRHSLQRIAEQAERAGRVIKSVHDFVRRREHQRETLRVDLLFESVLPLVRLQARKSGTRVELDLPPPPLPAVVCDRTMVEQVLLNLTRNGIQAMEDGPADGERVLTLRARASEDGRVTIGVADTGSGITPEVAERLFTPFFTTRDEGMGLGLSLCRTVAEQHGSTLAFAAAPGGAGTEFRFTLAAPKTAAAQAAANPAA